MLACFDIDGTIDADVPDFMSIMQALRAAGHHVAILTGCGCDVVTPQDIDDKKGYLARLGVGDAYDSIAVFPDPVVEAKVKWMEDNGADVLFDNKKETAAAAPCLALVPWKTRV